jgi:4'-phosphopantetheinyl transferase
MACDGTELCAVYCPDRLDLSLWERFLTWVAPQRQAHLRRFVRWQDAQRSLIGDILVLWHLSQKLGIAQNSFIFAKNSYGKPYLANLPSVHYNVSHSGDWVVAAFDQAGPVGVDIERIRPIDLDIARRFFAPEEYAELRRYSGWAQTEYFFRLWALKESYIKAVGQGLSLPLDSFIIGGRDGCITIEFRAGSPTAEYAFRTYDIDSGYCLALCGSHPALPNRVQVWRLEEFITASLAGAK